MEKKQSKIKSFFSWGMAMGLVSFCLVSVADKTMIQANESHSSHIGLFDGKTTFSLSSETGILPAFEIETKDVHGNVKLYENNSGKMIVFENKNESAIKSVTLKGRTSFNILRNNYALCNLPVSQEVEMSSDDITWDSPTYRIKQIYFTENMKPNHTYLIKVNVTELIGTDKLGSYVMDTNGNMIYSIANATLGDNIFIYTSTVEAKNFGIYLDVVAGKNAKIKEIMIIEYQPGMEDWNTSYFEGFESVIDPVITISNEDGSQTAIITVEEDIALRSNGDIYDELDLMTGKFTQRIDESGNILDKEIVRYVKINSTHTFEQNKDADISVVGNITPILGSITVPTDPLSFTLNPNLEKGQQFIAPDFSISNDSQAPIGLEIKSFEQTTTLLNDVLPDKYDSWEGLNKTQSKDIALALEPQPSESWISLNEGSYYVTNTSDIELGRVKGNSTVDFKFSALHGQSFTETLNPQYKLTFIFEF